MTQKLELKFLGNLEIYLSGAPVSDLKSIKAQALLCYLAVTGQSHTRSALAGLFWGDMPEAKARMNLSQALSTLRRFLGDFFDITRQTIALCNDRDIWVDVKRFEAGVMGYSRGKDKQPLQKSVDLYRGEFLENLILQNVPEFEAWAMAERTRLSELALRSLHTLAVHNAGRGEDGWVEAIKYTTRILTIEPWQEEAHRMMMRLLALCGRRSAALVQYERCRQILADELGIEPENQTTALYERIRDGTLSSWPEGKSALSASLPSNLPPSEKIAPYHNIPSQIPHFVGREAELSQLTKLLIDPAIRLVTIVGQGGIGKTQLSIMVTHQLAKRSQYEDGIVFVPLTAVMNRPHLISAIARQFDLSIAGTRQPEKALLDFFADKEYLIVLDSFEHLLPHVDFLEQILETSPQSKILITSRERLKLREEWVLDLEGLLYPASIQEAQVSDYGAIQLFDQRARQIRASFSLANNLAGVVRICQLTQGMPLALEQAASLIRVCQVWDIADRIENNLDALSTTLRNLPERHRSMRAVFDGSWRWLSDEERKVFRRVSVFRGSFTSAAAEKVSSTSLTVLASLVDKSLLRRSKSHAGTTRYDLHELVRQYAAERLLEAGQAEVLEVHKAHLDFFLSLAEYAEQFWDTEQEKEWLEKIEVERDNLHAALHWATEHEKTEHALRLNAALFTFWVYNSPAGEAMGALNSSLAMPWDEGSEATLRSRAKTLNVAGYAALNISDFELAKAHFEQGAKYYASLGDQSGLAWSLRGSGFVCMVQGDLANAQIFVEQSFSICQEFRDEWGQAWSTYDLGNIALASKKFDLASSLIEDALNQFRRLGIYFGAYRALISLGHLERGHRNWKESERYYREALAIQRKNHFIYYFAQVLEGLAHIAVAKDDLELAIKLLGAAQARRDSLEMARWAHQDIEYQLSLVLTRHRLPAVDWQANWDAGYNMAPQELPSINI